MIDHVFEVDSDDAALTAEIARLFHACQDAPGTLPTATRYVVGRCEEGVLVTAGDRILRAKGTRHDAIDTICADANRRAIESSTAPAVLHAGAVSRDGRAVVIAGDSGVGKSTLVTTLLRSRPTGGGWQYLTDEAAQITDDLMVPPYPKPLVRKEDDATAEVEDAGGRHHVAPGDLGEIAEEAATIAGLVLLGVEPGSPGTDLLHACRLTFGVGSAPEMLAVMARLVSTVPVVTLPARPDLGEAVADCERLLGARADSRAEFVETGDRG